MTRAIAILLALALLAPAGAVDEAPTFTLPALGGNPTGRTVSVSGEGNRVIAGVTLGGDPAPCAYAFRSFTCEVPQGSTDPIRVTLAAVSPQEWCHQPPYLDVYIAGGYAWTLRDAAPAPTCVRLPLVRGGL